MQKIARQFLEENTGGNVPLYVIELIDGTMIGVSADCVAKYSVCWSHPEYTGEQSQQLNVTFIDSSTTYSDLSANYDAEEIAIILWALRVHFNTKLFHISPHLITNVAFPNGSIESWTFIDGTWGRLNVDGNHVKYYEPPIFNKFLAFCIGEQCTITYINEAPKPIKPLYSKCDCCGKRFLSTDLALIEGVSKFDEWEPKEQFIGAVCEPCKETFIVDDVGQL